jgi:hypothetical protein
MLINKIKNAILKFKPSFIYLLFILTLFFTSSSMVTYAIDNRGMATGLKLSLYTNNVVAKNIFYVASNGINLGDCNNMSRPCLTFRFFLKKIDHHTLYG